MGADGVLLVKYEGGVIEDFLVDELDDAIVGNRTGELVVQGVL